MAPRIPTIMILAGFAATAFFAGCEPIADPSNVGPSGPRISESPVRNGIVPGDKAMLRMAGIDIPVQIKPVRHEEQVALVLIANDVVMDREVYHRDDKELSITFGAGEAFSPPIPLMRFPMRVGDTFDWSGVMMSNNRARGARAKVTSAVAKTDTGEGNETGVRVHVALDILPEQKGPGIKRSMTFWIVEGKGVVRREFGSDSVREPVR